MKRLFEDPSLSLDLRAELRDELQRSRRAGEDYDALAKLPLLHSALSDASRQPELRSNDASTSPGEGAPGAQHLKWPPLHVAPWTWKLALLATIGGTSLLAAWPNQREREARLERPALTQQAPRTSATPTPVAREVQPPVAERSAETPAPTQTIAEEPARPAPVARPVERSSRREIAQLQHVRALLEHDPAAAYRLAQRSEQEFPRGLLSEERHALQVLALAKSGATEAAARKAQQFFARYPESPLRERLEAALRK